MTTPSLTPLIHRSYSTPQVIGKHMRNTPHLIGASGWLPRWGEKEAIRELLANMVDQAATVQLQILHKNTPANVTALGTKFVKPHHFVVYDKPTGTILGTATWEHKPCQFHTAYHNIGKNKWTVEPKTTKATTNKVLEIVNYSSRMSHHSIQLGISGKRDNLSAIGTHGEGLTGACTVLTRNGCNMYVDCSADDYTASVFTFGTHVYYQLDHLQTTKTNALNKMAKKAEYNEVHNDLVRIRIIFPEDNTSDIDEIIKSIQLTDDVSGIPCERGMLLLGDEYCGKQFNRGFYVSETKSCLFGYNFTDPDKTMLQGRDRNCHQPDSCLHECGQIISHAIVVAENPTVISAVLDYFCQDATGNGEVQRYKDLEDGECLTKEAIDVLRKAAQQRIAATHLPIFCPRSTPHLETIGRMLNRNIYESHRLLRNDELTINEFYTQMRTTARPLAHNTLVRTHLGALITLFGCVDILGSDFPSEGDSISFWKIPLPPSPENNNSENKNPDEYLVYVVGDALLTTNPQGLTEDQCVCVGESLQMMGLSFRKIIQIYSLLNILQTTQPPMPMPLPLPMPMPLPMPECTICFDCVFPPNAFITRCNHVFHKECISNLQTPCCPNCRHSIPEIIPTPATPEWNDIRSYTQERPFAAGFLAAGFLADGFLDAGFLDAGFLDDRQMVHAVPSRAVAVTPSPSSSSSAEYVAFEYIADCIDETVNEVIVPHSAIFQTQPIDVFDAVDDQTGEMDSRTIRIPLPSTRTGTHSYVNIYISRVVRHFV